MPFEFWTEFAMFKEAKNQNDPRGISRKIRG